jgi:hypothetical protein
MAFSTPREVDRRYTRKLKEDILNKGLWDTGALYKSIDVTAEIDYNFATFMSANYSFTVKVYAEPYMVYLNEKYSLTSDFVASRSFQNTTERLRMFFRAYLANEYPLLNFDNITLEVNEVILVNQP